MTSTSKDHLALRPPNADEDADVDGSDPVYHFCYDDKWRVVGVWRGADTDPKELFIYHAAGVAGYGRSSYIDSVVLRDRDNSAKWSQAADGTLETRHYYAQNWRADVSAIFDNSGAVIEWQKYSAYGVPFLLTPGDHGKDGGISAADQTAFNADYAANNARADLNRDGAWTTADQTLFTASYNAAAVGGRWKLSAHVANRKGYAGYEHEGFGNDLAAPEIAHVRHRVLHFGLGRWTRRDPAEYIDGSSLTEYLSSGPVVATDPIGLCGAQVTQATVTSTRFCFVIPPWPALSVCLAVTNITVFGVCCCCSPPNDCAGFVRTDTCVQGGVFATGSMPPGFGGSMRPIVPALIGLGSDCPAGTGSNACDGFSLFDRICVIASVGFGSWTIGCRACYDRRSGVFSMTCGRNLGSGTGVALQFCDTCTAYTGNPGPCIAIF
ncbi:MAG: hypothetical protein KF869_04245 [Phycisphaeraceae bacterium]|nr:hypothetical protein [Phycisphaeraceae bacterium]